MKNRDHQMNKTASTYAKVTREGFAGTATAPGYPPSAAKTGPMTPILPGRASLAATALTYEQIAERAKALWRASGCLSGRDVQNWLEAEAQLKAELKSR
ncbi:MAG: DUF2934 domain-containing protein [Planctomycetes bacterium]|nr:DUF2934 domain-containing protein [Planctomycetota bacterium]